MNTSTPTLKPEALLTLPKAAKLLDVPVYALRRAAKLGTFPTYAAFSGRIRVRLSEVIIAIQAAQVEQNNDK